MENVVRKFLMRISIIQVLLNDIYKRYKRALELLFIYREKIFMSRAILFMMDNSVPFIDKVLKRE